MENVKRQAHAYGATYKAPAVEHRATAAFSPLHLAPKPAQPEYPCADDPPSLSLRFVVIAALLSSLHGLLIYWLLVWLGIGSPAP